jgi:hypothetical protein
MNISGNNDMKVLTYAANTGEVRAEARNAMPTSIPTDEVTLSATSASLASELSELAVVISAMPLSSARPQRNRKKTAGELTPILDVDAFRLIREKLRAQNLGKQAPSPEQQKDWERKAQATRL